MATYYQTVRRHNPKQIEIVGIHKSRKQLCNYQSVKEDCRISFLALQVIFICVYITNYFALFHYIFKFLTP